jgi:anti-sigma B factor antagonist
MPLPSYYRWLEIEQVGDVTVVRFTTRTILSNDAIEAIGGQLLGLVEQAGCRQFVLNLENVESISTAMVGKFVALHRRLEAAQGRLVLCRLGPFLVEIFKVLNLGQLARVYGEETEAVQSFGAASGAAVPGKD